MTPTLSLLICHLSTRKAELDRLMESVRDQCSVFQPDVVEVCIRTDDGTMSIGEKRNLLLSDATGKYVAFVDDDDMISDTYIADVLAACEQGCDCVSLTGRLCHISPDGALELGDTFVHSIEITGWYRGHDGVHYRSPNHLNPVKREIALSVGFRQIDFGEDKDYSKRLYPLLKTEADVSREMYYYVQRG